MHSLLLEFIVPWWENARLNPEKVFPKSFKCLDEIPIKNREIKKKQIEAGIKAGHDEILKMHHMLLSPPLIFLLLLSRQRGPLLMRSILTIVSVMGIELSDDGWGKHKYDDLLEKEKEWYDLLILDKEILTHFYKQIGFDRETIEKDLKKLSKAESVAVNAKDHGELDTFKNTYPILFSCLDATFGLMPSNSRIAEQTHGGLRESSKASESLAFTDAQQSYITNIEYFQRETQRRLIREKLSKNQECANQHHGAFSVAVKHNDRKETQELIGHQLMERGKLYREEKIKNLPRVILDKANVTVLKKEGSLVQNKLVRQMKKEKDDLRSLRSRTQPLTMCDVDRMIKSSQVDNDLHFENISPEEKQRNLDLDLLVKVSYWTNIKVIDGFHK